MIEISKTTDKHKSQAPKKLKAGVVTISDSKYDYNCNEYVSKKEKDDTSGKIIIKELKKAGHEVIFYTLIPDHEGIIIETVDHMSQRYIPDIIITTGGTGIGKKDVTVEAISSLFNKKLEGFGELFRIESLEEIGRAALLSRAVAGIFEGIVIFVLPGSPNAVKTGMGIIIEEAPHLVKHLRD